MKTKSWLPVLALAALAGSSASARVPPGRTVRALSPNVNYVVDTEITGRSVYALEILGADARKLLALFEASGFKRVQTGVSTIRLYEEQEAGFRLQCELFEKAWDHELTEDLPKCVVSADNVHYSFSGMSETESSDGSAVVFHLHDRYAERLYPVLAAPETPLGPTLQKWFSTEPATRSGVFLYCEKASSGGDDSEPACGIGYTPARRGD
jgi:hypothetical protein